MKRLAPLSVSTLPPSKPRSWRRGRRPIALACIQEKVPRPAWKTTPSWYLIAQEDRMINPATQRFLAQRMGAQIRSERIDHTPLVTAPELVVKMILPTL